MATHYGVAVLPTRARRPRDKAKVEVAVQVVERWILAALRHHQFFSLTELNAHIAQLLTQLNARPFRKLPGSRRSAFEQLDAPALRPLPSTPYVFSQWKKVRVHIDYHVEFERHYYSVPYALVKQQLDLRYTSETIEVMHRGERVSSHVRSSIKGGHSTHTEHMPKNHQHMGQWTPQRLVDWAESIGPSTAALIQTIMREREHPQQAYRACLGILRLSKTYGDNRLDNACKRALTLGTHRYRSIESILAKRLDERPITNAIESTEVLVHDNIRGADYYH